MDYKTTFKSWLLIALGVYLASITSGGIAFTGAGALLFAVIFISLLNTFLKPLLVVLALPFVILTMGIGLLIINALVFWLAGQIVPGFTVTGFWASLWGAILVSGVQCAYDLYRASKGLSVQTTYRFGNRTSGRQTRSRLEDDDVIDI